MVKFYLPDVSVYRTCLFGTQAEWDQVKKDSDESFAHSAKILKGFYLGPEQKAYDYLTTLSIQARMPFQVAPWLDEEERNVRATPYDNGAERGICLLALKILRDQLKNDISPQKLLSALQEKQRTLGFWVNGSRIFQGMSYHDLEEKRNEIRAQSASPRGCLLIFGGAAGSGLTKQEFDIGEWYLERVPACSDDCAATSEVFLCWAFVLEWLGAAAESQVAGGLTTSHNFLHAKAASHLKKHKQELKGHDGPTGMRRMQRADVGRIDNTNYRCSLKVEGYSHMIPDFMVQSISPFGLRVVWSTEPAILPELTSGTKVTMHELVDEDGREILPGVTAHGTLVKPEPRPNYGGSRYMSAGVDLREGNADFADAVWKGFKELILRAVALCPRSLLFPN